MNGGKAAREIERRIREFIATEHLETSHAKSRPKHGTGAYQLNSKRRKDIEDAAVKLVCKHFEGLGYWIDDHQKLNVGYDLTATKGDERLCIEVKGRSGPDVLADFTPNEYDMIKLEQRGHFKEGSYRICIVTDALGEGDGPELHHFALWRSDDNKTGEWWKVDGQEKLSLDPREAARGSIKSLASS